MHLIVIEQFADRVVGEMITEAREIEAIIKSEWARFVVRVDPDAVMPEITDKPESE